MKPGDKVKLSLKYKRGLCRRAADGDDWSKIRLESRKNAVGIVLSYGIYNGFAIQWGNDGAVRHHTENELTVISQ
jgi:hypothetical protein